MDSIYLQKCIIDQIINLLFVNNCTYITYLDIYPTVNIKKLEMVYISSLLKYFHEVTSKLKLMNLLQRKVQKFTFHIYGFLLLCINVTMNISSMSFISFFNIKLCYLYTFVLLDGQEKFFMEEIIILIDSNTTKLEPSRTPDLTYILFNMYFLLI